MYFSLIPDIQYDTKPIKYPFGSSDFVLAKNFFRRYRIVDQVFSYAVYFDKYAVKEGERPDQIAERLYSNAFYDWVIILTNNTINPLFDWPKSGDALRRYCEKKYDDPYAEILYYETKEVVAETKIRGDLTNKLMPIKVLEAGIKVDQNFYNNQFTYWNGLETVTVQGSSICTPVSAFDYEEKENELRREIWLLKPKYLQQFIQEFRKYNNYEESSDFVSARIKKTGVSPRR